MAGDLQPVQVITFICYCYGMRNNKPLLPNPLPPRTSNLVLSLLRK